MIDLPLFLVFVVQKQIQCISELYFFKKNNLVSIKPYFISFFSYISKGLGFIDKLCIVTYHYAYVKKIFSFDTIIQIFNRGLGIYTENTPNGQYSILLTYSSILEFEGSLSLVMKINDLTVFTLSFTFCPGKTFDLNDETIIYISRMQGTKGEFIAFSKATKHFKENTPQVVVLKTLESIAACLNIKNILAVTANQQVSFNDNSNVSLYKANYDEFWDAHGGTLCNGNYIIPCLSIPVQSVPVF